MRASCTTGPSDVPAETIITARARRAARAPPRRSRARSSSSPAGATRRTAARASVVGARHQHAARAALEQGADDRSISSGVLPSASTASGAPWRSSRCVSTRAKPRSRKGSEASCSSATATSIRPADTCLEQLLEIAAQPHRPDRSVGRHSPVKVGGRFSENDSTPSRKSELERSRP